MAERTTISQIVQLGVEAQPGTGVAATKKLQSVDLSPGIKAAVQTFKPKGGKFATVASLGKEWVEADYEGPLTFTEVVYLLSGCANYAAPAQQGTTAAYKWTFTPGQSTEDAFKTYTVEQGSATRAHKFTYGLVTGFGFTLTREEFTCKGSIIGQALQDNQALSGGTTALELVPCLPAKADVYLDDTGASIGTTKLTRVLKTEFELSERYGPLWAINSAVSGFAAAVETDPKCTLKLLVEADATGMALLTALRNGTKKFVRVKCAGDTIETPYDYLFQTDVCVTFEEPDKFEDADGVYAIQFNAVGAYDSTWAKALEFQVINKLTAL